MKTSNSKLKDGMTVGFAEYHHELISKNVKRAMEHKASQGYLMHKPPLGYSQTQERGIYQLDNLGIALKNLLPGLVRKGKDIRVERFLSFWYESNTGRKASKALLKEWLSNPYYVGLVVHNGKKYPGLHQRLISDEVQKRLIKALS